MRYSRMLIPTLREDPGEAEIVSHCLMLRSGLIRKLAAGVYNFLPLGWRVMKKIEQIVREEMELAGAQEVFLPVLCPSELWHESARWDAYGKELMRITDRHGRDFCLGPTHEEVITDLVRREVRSYRQLPINLYQIQTKFRDEIRPRFGLMRGREFMMKDGYSFDRHEAGAQRAYSMMYKAYNRIFARCGLDFRAVEADSGPIGGSFSHEFMVLAESGEDSIASCTECDYASNLEKAECVGPRMNELPEGPCMKDMAEVETPGRKSVEDVCEFLGCRPEQLVKTMIFIQEGKPLAVLVRGDHEVNEIKLKNLLGGVSEVILADESTIEYATGGPSGFSGPVGLKGLPILADLSLKGMVNFVVGANEADKHLLNVNLDRDFKVDRYADLRYITDKDKCPRCSGILNFHRGIEVGHVFKLGTKYSKSMKAVFLDEDGREQYMIMGCYGIGIGRTMAAAIEQNHDEDGIIWPLPIAPFQVHILPVNMDNEDVSGAGEEIYQDLQKEGIEVLLDDRDESPGIKFKDADLIGIPLRVTVGIKSLREGMVEMKWRDSKDVVREGLPHIAAKVRNMIEDKKRTADSKLESIL
ncbi:proline--tRNA ligase [bacterium]|nr:proline--tRNA ligase [bacterium]